MSSDRAREVADEACLLLFQAHSNGISDGHPLTTGAAAKGYDDEDDDMRKLITAALATERALTARRTLRVVEQGRAADPLRYILDGLLALDDAGLLEAIE